MTAYEQGRYDIFRRVCQFGEAYRAYFPDGSQARETIAVVAQCVEELDALASRKREAKRHSWRRQAEARKALTARIHELARIARDEAKRVPSADDRFPVPRQRWDLPLLFHGRMFVGECAKAREMFLRYGVPDTFVADLKALVDAFDESRSRGWDRRSTIFLTRKSAVMAFERGLDAVQTLDVIVGNAMAQEPALLAVWRDIRRNDSRRRTVATTPPALIIENRSPEPKSPVEHLAQGANNGWNASVRGWFNR